MVVRGLARARGLGLVCHVGLVSFFLSGHSVHGSLALEEKANCLEHCVRHLGLAVQHTRTNLVLVGQLDELRELTVLVSKHSSNPYSESRVKIRGWGQRG